MDYKVLQEPVFFIDEYLVKGEKEIENILKELKKKPFKEEYKAKFLRDYTNLLFQAHKKLNQKPDPEQEKIRLKKLLEEKRKLLLEKIQEMQKKEELPQPISKETPLHKDLIISKVTNKVLASRKISNQTYELMEPFIKENEKNIIQSAKEKNLNEEGLKTFIQEQLHSQSQEDYERLRYHILRDTISNGQVSPLLEEEDMEEIICEGVNEELKITMKNKGKLATNISYPSKEALNEQINILAKKANAEISQDHPFLDAQLPNGFQIQANLGTDFSRPRFIIHK